MNSVKQYQIKFNKLFSIPGRIRLGVEGLKYNLNLAFNIENTLIKLPKIYSVKTNIKTGTILLTYDYYSIKESELFNCFNNIYISTENSISIIFNKSKNSLRDLYTIEKSLSKRLSIFSIVSASILLFSSAPMYSIAAIILGFPGIIYFLSYLSMKYSILASSLENISISNINIVRKLQNIQSISMHPSIIFDDNKIKNINSTDCTEIESLISRGIIEDPITKEIRTLIKDLRTLGINNLSIFTDKEKIGILLYANKTLGFSDIKENMLPEMILVNEKNIDTIEPMDSRLILCIHGCKISNLNNIDIVCHEFHQISCLIKNCMQNNQYLNRSQVAAVSINIIGIMLTILRYLNLTSSMIFYLINMFGNMIYLNYKTLHSIKEIANGKQRQFITT